MNAGKQKVYYFRKEICILLYVVLNADQYYGRMMELGFTFKGIFYIGLFLCVLAGLFTVSYIQNHLLRVLYALILFSSAITVDSFIDITSTFLTYSSFISLLDAKEFAHEAWTQHSHSFTTSIAIASFLLVGISLKPRKRVRWPDWSFILSSLLVVFILSMVVYATGRGAGGLPSPFTPLAYSSLALYEASSSVIGERKGIEVGRKDIQIEYDIVLIIDESISASYLDINSEFGVASGLKNVASSIKVYNYGYAASITNCSAGTNVSLRYGGTRQDYLRIISTMPSLWQYAKGAHLKTVYIDAQRTGRGLQNGMTAEELEEIDEFIQFDGIPVLERDMAAAAKLIEYLNNDRRELIILNKMGAHFPIHDKYPDAYLVYEPALPRGDNLNVGEASARKVFSGDMDEWLLYRNSYRNTLLWNVAQFFNLIFKSADLSNAVIIYTSDHGQDLHEKGNPGNHTHCSSDPRMEEGLVPLVVIEGAALKTLDWVEHLRANVNGSSHYNIFPTLLSLMHYRDEQFEPIYGVPLSKVTDDEMTFNTMFKARLGREPKWKKIDLKGLAIPPELGPPQEKIEVQPVCTVCTQIPGSS